MSKLKIAAFIVGAITAVVLPAASNSATAADLQVSPAVAQPQTADSCGPCGCLRVSYDHHRELRSTYGIGFDPRNFDGTVEPHYYFGPMRAYPRYWVATDY